jgi:hypothetical protein
MSALRPQRTLFPNSGLGKPLFEKVCFVVKTVSRGNVRKVRFETSGQFMVTIGGQFMGSIVTATVILTHQRQLKIDPPEAK